MQGIFLRAVTLFDSRHLSVIVSWLSERTGSSQFRVWVLEACRKCDLQFEIRRVRHWFPGTRLHDAADSTFAKKVWVQMLVRFSNAVIITSFHQENFRFCEVSLTFELAENVKADVSELMRKE